ncbi:MAG: DsbC family protein [Kangiellaceae bacterium]|jgi:thiol:disulfide interchange protein DsbC|nr:DsbC family protein [Kangiellaceae bacterium]
MNKIVKFLSHTALISLVFGCNEATSETERASAPSDTMIAPAGAGSSSQTVDSATKQALTDMIKQQLGGINIQKISKSEMPGFYEVYAQGQMIYVSEDRKFLFPGPLLTVAPNGLVNLTQKSMQVIDMEKAPERAKLMAAVKEADTVLFKAPNEKYRINVFTDVDCAYCRRLHQNMDGYLERGISVRYLAFPRAGVGSGAYNKLVSVWCAEDRKAAMDDAKLKNVFNPKECANPIADHYAMTRQLGLTGTPAIIFESGKLISGFLEPKDLIVQLENNG